MKKVSFSIEEIDVNEFDIVLEEAGIKKVLIPAVDTLECAKRLVNDLTQLLK